MFSLSTPIEKAPRISLILAGKLMRLGIQTIRDLLFNFPSRYEDFSNFKKIKELSLGETATIQGIIKKIGNIRTFRKKMFITEAIIDDSTGAIKSVWFNQPFLARTLKVGEYVSLAGKIANGPKGPYLQNPSYEKIGNYSDRVESPRQSRDKFPEHQSKARRGAQQITNKSNKEFQPSELGIYNSQQIHTGGLIAVYPETEGLTSRWIRFLIKNFIVLAEKLEETLPEETLYRQNLWGIRKAVKEIHFPSSKDGIKKAERRLAFEEMLMVQLRTIREKIKLKGNKSPAIKPNIDLTKKFISTLPFKLTDAQRRSLWEIMQDISKPRPMNRLLEGDVGSGKTVVAAAASLLTAKAGYQTAYLAPTEILASQHFATFKNMLSKFGVSVGLCTANQKKCFVGGETAEKNMSQEMIENGALDITIGTHAILNNKIKFKNLGLVIIDEQHRFGVEQRAKLIKNQETRSKNYETPNSLIHNSKLLIPHFLSMTATPIPRTLALTLYGDLDISFLDELPKNRKEIITNVVMPSGRKEAYNFIRQEIKNGRQAFVICPRIEIKEQTTNDKRQTTIYRQKFLQADVKAVKEEYKKLSENVFPDLRVAMLHGKMKPKEKTAVMKKFSGAKNTHEIDILVSTSVVEVGVDVPNATVMLIEGAERFGLAQLHQFRGRIGRGEHQSYCFLFTDGDTISSQRLRAVAQAKNGFEIAEKDLEIRGPGDVFGVRQSGVPDIVLKNLNDQKLIREARQEATALIQKDVSLKSYPILLKKLEEMERMVHFE